MPASPNRPQTRRERRAAARAAARPGAVAARPPARLARLRRDPLALVSGLGIAIVLVAFAAINLTAPDKGGYIEPAELTKGLTVEANTLGAKDAPVTVTVYEDFQCPACAQWESRIVPSLIGEYVRAGKVRLEVRAIAILDADETGESHRSALAAGCALEQDRFWPYHGWLYANQRAENSGGFSEARLEEMAKRSELDLGVWRTCRDDEAGRTKLFGQMRSLIEDAGITQTPTILIDGAFWKAGVPAWSDLRTEIDSRLAAAAASPAVEGSPSPAPAAGTASPSPAPAAGTASPSPAP